MFAPKLGYRVFAPKLWIPSFCAQRFRFFKAQGNEFSLPIDLNLRSIEESVLEALKRRKFVPLGLKESEPLGAKTFKKFYF